MDQVGGSWKPDGDVVYRREIGDLIAVLPRYCRRGEHDLAATRGYETSQGPDGVLRVSCRACSAAPRPDHAWGLRTIRRAPVRAELDDAPYAELRKTLGGTNGIVRQPPP